MTQKLHEVNEDRADWACAGVDAFAVETFGGRTFTAEIEAHGENGDAPDMIADLIGDLCHLAQRHNLDPRELLERGWRAYEYESADGYEGD